MQIKSTIVSNKQALNQYYYSLRFFLHNYERKITQKKNLYSRMSFEYKNICLGA